MKKWKLFVLIEKQNEKLTIFFLIIKNIYGHDIFSPWNMGFRHFLVFLIFLSFFQLFCLKVRDICRTCLKNKYFFLNKKNSPKDFRKSFIFLIYLENRWKNNIFLVFLVRFLDFLSEKMKNSEKRKFQKRQKLVIFSRRKQIMARNIIKIWFFI